MIQIYQAGNETFDKNGDAVLICYSCEIKAELNGTWVLSLEIPIDKEGRWKFVTENAVLKVPTWQEDEQLYRIYNYTKTENGISATAYPIFWDSANDAFLMDKRPTSKSGQQALNIMMDGTPYSGSSDITVVNTAYFVRRNLLDALQGNSEPTFLQRWGGEVLYDNYNIIINNRVGGDYGYEARYGKNIDGVKYAVDMSGLCTRIVPVAFNGRMMSGNTPYVDSSNISSYPMVFTKEVKYENIKLAIDAEGASETDTICDDQSELDDALQAAAEADFDAGCDTPKVTLDIDMRVIRHMASKTQEAIQDTEGENILDEDSDPILANYYRDYATLEKVLLGDTVHCRHTKLDIITEARVIAMTWDCVMKNVSSITLGDYKYNYVSVVNQAIEKANKAIREDGTLMAEKVSGFIDGQNAMLRAQYNLATHQHTMAILFENKDSESLMYGALGIGTQGLCISKERTADGRDWVWTTGITANGINTGMGVFGTIADATGHNYWNLDTGELVIGGSAELDGNMVSDILDDIEEAAQGATNFLRFTVADGLSVYQDTTDTTGYNVNIKSDGLRIRHGTTTSAWLKSDGLYFYKPDGTTVAAKYTTNGLEVETGKIGGFTITNNRMYRGSLGTADSFFVVPAGTDNTVDGYVSIGGSWNYDGWVLTVGNSFGVLKDGSLYCDSVYLEGEINATSGTFTNVDIQSGTIGGFTIDATSIHSDDSANVYLLLSPAAAGNEDLISVRVGSVYPFYVRADGFMHVNSMTAGNYKISENNIQWGESGTPITISQAGAITATAFNVSSDRRLKKDIELLSERHEQAFMELEPVKYIWNTDDTLHYGFIAQDVEKAFKKHGIEGVTECQEGWYSMRYDELIALCVHMIQKIIKDGD